MLKKLFITGFLIIGLFLSFQTSLYAFDLVSETGSHTTLDVDLSVGEHEIHREDAFRMMVAEFFVDEHEHEHSHDSDSEVPADVRFLVDGVWSEWSLLHHDDENEVSYPRVFSRPVFTQETHDVQIRVREPMRMKLAFYDLAAPSQFFAQAGVRASSKGRIISRSQWGADESLRIYNGHDEPEDIEVTETNGFPEKAVNVCEKIENAFPAEFGQLPDRIDTHGGKDLIWPIRYSQKIRKIVVHHTVSDIRDLNEDGVINVLDYEMQVRGIYNFHTVTRGWGDVGYNFLIDPLGNVYEGRSGRQRGKMPVAAHVLCQNTGTLGIALIGDFNKEPSVSRLQRNALSQLVADLSTEYGIVPSQKSFFRGKLMPNVVGHKDIGDITKSFIGKGATSCPGSGLYSLLANVIADAGKKMVKDYDIAFENLPETLSLIPGDKDTMWEVRFRNNGVKDLNDTIVKLSTGQRSVVGDLAAGQWGTATFHFDGGMKSLRKNLSLLVYSKQGRRSKKVGVSDEFLLSRDAGYVTIAGDPVLYNADNRFIAGDHRVVTLRYPIETNANVSAGTFKLAGFSRKAQQIVQEGYNIRDIRPVDNYLDIPVRFVVSTRMRGGSTALPLQLSAEGFKLKGGNRRGVVKKSIGMEIVTPRFSSDTFVLERRTDSMSYASGESAEMDFRITTLGLSSDVLEAITDGDLSLEISSSDKRLRLGETSLPLQLDSDGVTLFAKLPLSSSRPVSTVLEASLAFGGEEVRSLSGPRGFKRLVRFEGSRTRSVDGDSSTKLQRRSIRGGSSQ